MKYHSNTYIRKPEEVQAKKFSGFYYQALCVWQRIIDDCPGYSFRQVGPDSANLLYLDRDWGHQITNELVHPGWWVVVHSDKTIEIMRDVEFNSLYQHIDTRD